jgi:hypothetical protein
MTFKHAVFMSLARREIVSDNGHWVEVIDYLKPDPNGPYYVVSDRAEPTWAELHYKSVYPVQKPSADTAST